MFSRNSIACTLRCTLAFGIIYAVLGSHIVECLYFLGASIVLPQLSPGAFQTRDPFSLARARGPRVRPQNADFTSPPPCSRQRYYQPLEGHDLERSLKTIRIPPSNICCGSQTSGSNVLRTIRNLFLTCSGSLVYGFRTYSRLLWPRGFSMFQVSPNR